ncbi:MAG: hypothetical protein RJA99_3214 [Pseudomonadota bacterium]|jgi:hypothetical protein
MLTRVSKLADKAILVKLTIRRAALTRRDNALTAKVQAAEQDVGITVLTKLFTDKASPINKIMRAVNEVYSYHKTQTLPYVDAGPRILPNANYFTYTHEVQHKIALVENMLDTYMPYYDQLVRDDVMYRNAGRAAGRAHVDEYPSADAFRRSMSLEYKFSPMPDARHFLFDLSEADMQAVEQAENDALAAANADTINRMLKPLGALVERLGEYQGGKGERFHPTVISNVLDGIKEARSLMLFPNAELEEHIAALETLTKKYLDNVEMVKGSAVVRDDARAKLKEAADKMSAYF